MFGTLQLLDKCLFPFPLNTIRLECLRIKLGKSLVQVSRLFQCVNDDTEARGNGWVWRE